MKTNVINSKQNLEGKTCTDCARGDFPDLKGTCRADNSYFCYFHKKGVCKYSPACGDYKPRKN